MLELNPDFGSPLILEEEACRRSFLALTQELKSREESILDQIRSFEWTRARREFDAPESLRRMLEETINQFVQDASSGDPQRFFNCFQDLGVRLFRRGYPSSACHLLVAGVVEYLQVSLIGTLDDAAAQSQLSAQTVLAGQEALANLLTTYYEEQARVHEAQLQRTAERARILSILSEGPLSSECYERLLKEITLMVPCDQVSLKLRKDPAQSEDEFEAFVGQEVNRSLESGRTGSRGGRAAITVTLEGEPRSRGQLTVRFASPSAITAERRQLVHWIGAELEERLRAESGSSKMAGASGLESHLAFLRSGLSNSSRPEDFEHLLMRMARTLRCDRALLFRFDSQRQSIVAETGIDCDLPTLEEFALPLDQFHLAQAAFAKGEPVVSLGGDPYSIPLSIRLRFDLRAAIAVPIRSGGADTGLVLFGNSLPGRTFSPEQIAYSTIYGQLLGLIRRAPTVTPPKPPAPSGTADARQLSEHRQQALEELARAVRHEINNPLTGILGNAQLLLERTDLPAEVYPQLREVEALSLRVRGILHELKDVKDQTAVYVGDSRMIDLKSDLPVNTRVKRALVVDDEPTILRLLSTILTSEGYEVASSDNGAGALGPLEAQAFDLILLDFKLPGMSGREIYRWIESNRPDQARNVIFVTGDTSTEETLDFVSTAGCRFLRKPFTIEELQAIIAGELKGV